MYSGAGSRTGFLYFGSAHRYSYCRMRRPANHQHLSQATPMPGMLGLPTGHTCLLQVRNRVRCATDLWPRGHEGAAVHGAKLLEGAKQHADGIVKVHSVDGQPFAQVLPHRQADSFTDIPTAECRFDVPLERQALSQGPCMFGVLQQKRCYRRGATKACHADSDARELLTHATSLPCCRRV